MNTSTLIIGWVLGIAVVSAAIYVYVKHNRFGVGGVVLMAFGLLFVGLSLWKTIELNVSKDGSLVLKVVPETRQAPVTDKTILENIKPVVEDGSAKLKKAQKSSSELYNPRSTTGQSIFSRGAAAQEFVRVAHGIVIPNSMKPGEQIEVSFKLLEHIVLDNISPISIFVGRVESENYASSVYTDYFKPQLGENRLLIRLPNTAKLGDYVIELKLFVGEGLAKVEDLLDPTLDVTLYSVKKDVKVLPKPSANN